MIKKIHIYRYRKLKDINLNFSKGLNAISGTNGTCKSSLLHMISNSFQKVTKKSPWIHNSQCLEAIKNVNAVINPKVESLTRGDKQYNDPAHGLKGILFTVDYYSKNSLDFRKHNSDLHSRYSVKPKYKQGAGEKLPHCPVVYLGLSRLVPFGEYQNEDAIANGKDVLPDIYREEISDIYKRFTHYKISYLQMQKMGDMKTRAEFSSNVEGIDSNTISAGEDNLYIILSALMSLRFYFESIVSNNEVESILLIDEFDATLHPAYQVKLLDLLREYSEKYKIQIIFTTHSMSTLENLLEKKDKVIYLIDNMTNIALMPEPNIYKIKMYLSSLTSNDIYRDKVIPIFTEDEEARMLLDMLFDYFETEKKYSFSNVRHFFHIVKVNLGANNLQDIFNDGKLLRITMSSICILDGDKSKNLSNCTLALPGKNKKNQASGLSPEKLLFDYANILFESDDQFWIDPVIIGKGYSKTVFIDRVKIPLEEYENEYSEIQRCKKEIRDNPEQYTTEDEKNIEERQRKLGKKPREFYKSLFNKDIDFFKLLFKHWLHNVNNRYLIDEFYMDLKKLFKQVSVYNEISADEWR